MEFSLLGTKEENKKEKRERERKKREKRENKISDKLPVRLFLTTRSHERVTALPQWSFLQSRSCNVHYHYYTRRVTNWTNSVSTPYHFLALCCFFTNVGWFHFVFRYDDLSRSLLSENDDVKSDNVHCNKLSRSSSLRRSSDLNSSASSTVSPKPWRRFSERFR